MIKPSLSVALKIFGITVLIIVLVILIWIIYLWATYIDERFTSGEAYGFQIGSSKFEVYSDAPRNLARLAVTPGMYFVNIEVSESLAPELGVLPETNLLVQTQFTPESFEKFSDLDIWIIYFEGNYMNSLTLIFCEDRLCEVRRHRQYFELP